jgi:hypothetical protein
MAHANSTYKRSPDDFPAGPFRGPFRWSKKFDLHDKVFAVTGGARGLGLAMAEALMEAGGEGE